MKRDLKREPQRARAAARPSARPTAQTLDALSGDIRAAMRQFADVFKTWGAQGGKTRAKRLTSARRSEIAKQAAETRWKKKRPTK